VPRSSDSRKGSQPSSKLPNAPETLEDGFKDHLMRGLFEPPKERTLEEAFDDAFKERYPSEDDEDEEEEDSEGVFFTGRNEEG